EGSGGESRQSLDGDRVTAPLAPTVVALAEPLDGALHLSDPLEQVVGERDLLLALERLGAGVGLVVTGRIGEPAPLQFGDLAERLVVLGLQLVPALGQSDPD